MGENKSINFLGPVPRQLIVLRGDRDVEERRRNVLRLLRICEEVTSHFDVSWIFPIEREIH